MKFKRNDIGLITTSLAVGGIAALIAKLLHFSALIPIGAMLLTTMIWRVINKYNHDIYRFNLQFKFIKKEHVLILSIIGIRDNEVSISWLSAKKLGCIIDVNKITQSLVDNGIELDEYDCLHINGELLQANNFIAAYRIFEKAKQIILPQVEQLICNSAISITLSNDKKPKRKSLLFWR